MSWLPGRHLSRGDAITAMVLADVAASQHVHEGHWTWPHVEEWAAALGMTAPDALARTVDRPGQAAAEHGAEPADPEAGG